MIQPIKAGDAAIVINGALGLESPNVGKFVRVQSLRGDHSKLGRIWTCSGKDIVQAKPRTTKEDFDPANQHDPVPGQSWADFPAAWLLKLPPKLAKREQLLREAELT